MEPTPGSATASAVKKTDEDEKPDRRDVKPIVKTLNRVPRAFPSPVSAFA